MTISKTYHARANSFPSKSHPVAITVEENLCRLKSCYETSSVSSEESSLIEDANAYASSRKTIKKMVNKSMRELKRFEKISSLTLVKQDKNPLPTTVTILKESEIISFSILKSVLMNLSTTKELSKQSGWSLMPKVMQSRQENNVNDVQIINDALSDLIYQKAHKENKVVQVQNVLKILKTLQMTIQEIEEELQTIFRSLIKRRVSLLNAVNH